MLAQKLWFISSPRDLLVWKCFTLKKGIVFFFFFVGLLALSFRTRFSVLAVRSDPWLAGQWPNKPLINTLLCLFFSTSTYLIDTILTYRAESTCWLGMHMSINRKCRFEIVFFFWWNRFEFVSHRCYPTFVKSQPDYIFGRKLVHSTHPY